MHRHHSLFWIHTVLFGITALLLESTTVQADVNPIQPGLWELAVLNQTHDGKPVPNVNTMLQQQHSRMEQNMAAMPPAQRARMQAIMSRMQGMSSPDGKLRICITPEMVARNATFANPHDTHCPPTQINRQGNSVSFSFSCTTHGMTTQGHGVSMISNKSVHTTVDIQSQDSHGHHVSHNESQMTWVNSSCGAVQPLNAMIGKPM